MSAWSLAWHERAHQRATEVGVGVPWRNQERKTLDQGPYHSLGRTLVTRDGRTSRVVARCEDDVLIVEFHMQDSLIGLCKSKVKTIQIPLPALAAAHFQSKLFTAVVTLHVHSIHMVQDIPGSCQGEVRLHAARTYRKIARAFVTELGLWGKGVRKGVRFNSRSAFSHACLRSPAHAVHAPAYAATLTVAIGAMPPRYASIKVSLPARMPSWAGGSRERQPQPRHRGIARPLY